MNLQHVLNVLIGAVLGVLAGICIEAYAAYQRYGLAYNLTGHTWYQDSLHLMIICGLIAVVLALVKLLLARKK